MVDSHLARGHDPGNGHRDEFPNAVYISVTAAFVWMILVACIVFGSGGQPVIPVALVTFILALVVAFVLFNRLGKRRQTDRKEPLNRFLSAEVNIATGSVSGREAWIEVAIIPVALALAATLLAIIYMVDALG